MGIYVINLNEDQSIGTHWIALYVNGNGWAYSKKKVKKFMGKINFTTTFLE